MKTIFAIAIVALMATSAIAARSEHGNITTIYPDQADSGLFALVESVAPGVVPNGVFYYTVIGVEAGAAFTVVADDGQEPFVIGLADECPGPTWRGPMLAALQAGDVNGALGHAQNAWLLCNNHPDFDLKFTGGEYGNGPGDEAGIVPGPGDAVVTLFFGDPEEGFTYSEA